MSSCLNDALDKRSEAGAEAVRLLLEPIKAYLVAGIMGQSQYSNAARYVLVKLRLRKDHKLVVSLSVDNLWFGTVGVTSKENAFELSQMVLAYLEKGETPNEWPTTLNDYVGFDQEARDFLKERYSNEQR